MGWAGSAPSVSPAMVMGESLFIRRKPAVAIKVINVMRITLLPME
jgi:1,2-phenylacetyl-CoA epoxidase PaaB subunit